IIALGALQLSISSTSGHTLHWGRTCPAVQPFPNLDVEKILGPWYILYKTDTDNTCLIWNIEKGEISETLQVKETRQLSVLDVFGVNHTHAVTARIDIPNPEVPAKMRIRWPTSITGKADFIIFDTDYDKYVAVFECDRAGFLHRRSTAILSRTLLLEDALVERVRRLLATFEADDYHLGEISHTACRVSGAQNWHIDGELLSLPGVDEVDVQGTKLEEFQDYDITQLEIVGDHLPQDSDTSFRGSLREVPPAI
ncbi:hypothetical protein SK128_008030, partial [Halocaridina rubra]